MAPVRAISILESNSRNLSRDRKAKISKESIKRRPLPVHKFSFRLREHLVSTSTPTPCPNPPLVKGGGFFIWFLEGPQLESAFFDESRVCLVVWPQ